MATLEEVQAHLPMLDGPSRLFLRGEIKALPTLLDDGEQINYAVKGHSWGSNGLFVATNKRLLFIDKQFLRVKTKDFPYETLTEIESSSGLVLGKIVVRTTGGKFSLKGVPREHVKPFIDVIREGMSANRESRTPADDCILSQLERLQALRDQGVLTEAEFLEQKGRILANSQGGNHG